MIFLDKQSKRSKDENGYLTIRDNPIAKAGVFKYLLSELFLNINPQDDKVVNVFRSFDDLKKVKDTFSNKPIMYNHKWGGKDGEKQADGAIGSIITSNEDDLTLYADTITIYNPDLVKAIEDGDNVELSPGYWGEAFEETGRFNGESYQYRQIPDLTNHLAVVSGGRAGADLKIQDSKIKLMKGEEMAKNPLQKILDSLKRVLDEESKKLETDKVEDECKTNDEDVKVEDSKLSEIEAIIGNSEMSEEDKLKAIYSLAKIEDEEVEVKAEDEETKTEDEEVDPVKKDDIAEEVGELVTQIVEKKLANFQDAQSKLVARIQDSYSKVSSVVGAFDFAGKSEKEIYAYGYEALTGNSLSSDMDSKTAFNIASDSRTPKFNDSKPATKQDDKMTSLLSRFN